MKTKIRRVYADNGRMRVHWVCDRGEFMAEDPRVVMGVLLEKRDYGNSMMLFRKLTDEADALCIASDALARLREHEARMRTQE